MTERLGGKAVLITGATSGIGLAIAERFAAEEARLLLTGRNGQVGKELESALQPLGEILATDRSSLDLADEDGRQQDGAT